MEINQSSNVSGNCIPCALRKEGEKINYAPYLLIISGFALTIYFSAFYAALFLVGPIMVYFGVKSWTAMKSKEQKMKLKLLEFEKSLAEDKIKILEG